MGLSEMLDRMIGKRSAEIACSASDPAQKPLPVSGSSLVAADSISAAAHSPLPRTPECREELYSMKNNSSDATSTTGGTPSNEVIIVCGIVGE